ncbi:hypothetical protein GALL_262010 [mine drainage metagenome]|uniref:Uncharacterized protein n=1 Tax=mine drainage metagenome TaxID=410659 RepID=A0A1J5R768_9ZZZZ
MHHADTIEVVNEQVVGTAVKPALPQVVLGQALSLLFRDLASFEQVILFLYDAHARFDDRTNSELLLFEHMRAKIKHHISAEQHQAQQHAAQQYVKARLERQAVILVHDSSPMSFGNQYVHTTPQEPDRLPFIIPIKQEWNKTLTAYFAEDLISDDSWISKIAMHHYPDGKNHGRADKNLPPEKQHQVS